MTSEKNRREAEQAKAKKLSPATPRVSPRSDGLKKGRAPDPKPVPAKSVAYDAGELDARRLYHELKVHELELQAHNDELVAARAERESMLEKYTELFEFAPIGYAILGRDETIRELNHTAALLLGRERHRLVGTKFVEHIGLEGRNMFHAFLATALESDRNERCDTHMHTATKLIPVQLTVHVLSSDDRRFLLAFEDFSERNERERRLADAEQRLREADRRKDEVLAALSHELRNPLTPVKNSLFVLTRAAIAEDDVRTAVRVIDRQVTHLTRLVDDLLDVTRIARGKTHLRFEHVELVQLVRATVDDHVRSFAAGGIQFEARLDDGPIGVHCDPARIIQVVSNLLGNARKFTPGGGRVDVTLSARDGFAQLQVRDDGSGIEANQIGNVFEPFAQAPQPADRAKGGLGLGLAMVKGLVELHSGTVTIASDGSGRGTLVTVFLPLDESPRVEQDEEPPPSALRRRILIIEDNADAADTLELALKMAAHDLRVAYDGRSGLEIAREFRPEIVICDIGLPGMDGYDVARAFRSDNALRGVFLIALSGYARLEDRRAAADAGFNQHVAKPPNMEILRRLLDQAPAFS